MTSTKGPKELSDRFRVPVGPIGTKPQRYPRKAVKARLRKRLEDWVKSNTPA